MSNWTVTGGALVQGPPSTGPTGTDGTHAAIIGPYDTPNSAIAQTVNVQPGITYVLSSTSAASAPYAAGRTSIYETIVEAAGQVLTSEMFSDVALARVGEGTNGFSPHSLSFAVPNGVYELALRFVDRNPSGGSGIDVLIDDVRLDPGVPGESPRAGAWANRPCGSSPWGVS